MPAGAGGLFHFQFAVAGEAQIDALLGLAAEALGDLTPAWDAIHDDFIEVMREQFASEGARGPSGAWDRYSGEPVYRAVKGRILNSHFDRFPILRWAADKGASPEPGERLYPSLTEKGHPEHVWRSSADAFEVGTSVPHAIEHQRGGGFQKWDKVPTPQRKIIDLRNEDAQRWTKLIQQHVMSRLDAAGRVAVRRFLV